MFDMSIPWFSVINKKAYLPTHTPWQGGTPYPSSPTQAGYLVFTFQTVACEAGEYERVTDPELEANSSTVGRHSGILARLQIVLCQRRTMKKTFTLIAVMGKKKRTGRVKR